MSEHDHLLYNLTWIVFSRSEHVKSIGGRAVRISSSHMSLGGRGALTIGQSNAANYFYYANETKDHLAPEWAWFLLFGFVALVILMTVGVVAFQNCCVGETEEDETAVSGDEADEMEMEEYLEERKKEGKQKKDDAAPELTELVI